MKVWTKPLVFPNPASKIKKIYWFVNSLGILSAYVVMLFHKIRYKVLFVTVWGGGSTHSRHSLKKKKNLFAFPVSIYRKSERERHLSISSVVHAKATPLTDWFCWRVLVLIFRRVIFTFFFPLPPVVSGGSTRPPSPPRCSCWSGAARRNWSSRSTRRCEKKVEFVGKTKQKKSSLTR